MQDDPFADIPMAGQVPAIGGPRRPRTIVVGEPDPHRNAQAAHDAAETARLYDQMRRDQLHDNRPPPSEGYRYKADGTQEAIPGGPADPSSAAFRALHPAARNEQGATPEQRTLRATLENDEVLRAIRQARTLAHDSWGATGTLAPIMSHVPGTGSNDLRHVISTIGANTTINRLAELKSSSATGASGFGSLTEREGQLLRDSIASLGQDQTAAQFNSNLDAIEQHYRSLRAIEVGQDPREPAVAAAIGLTPQTTPAPVGSRRREVPPVPGVTPPPGAPPPGPPGTPPAPPAGPGPNDGSTPNVALGADGTTIETDPTLRGLNARVAQMIREGAATDAPPGEVAHQIEAYVQSAGVAPERVNGQIEPWVQWIRRNPNFQGPMANFEAHAVPMTGVRGALNSATNALPSEVPAYLLGAGDMVTGGNLDSMSSNPELTRLGMGQMANENPKSTLLGNVSGAALLSAGGEGALGGLGMEGGRGIMAARSLLTDGAIGGYYGAGSNDDNRLGGAVLGTIAGLGGGIAGRAGGRVIGGVVRGVTDPAARFLAARGVPLTIGQMVGRSGRIGNMVRGIEDRAAGLPIIGSLINPMRRRGLERFNSATINEALDPIGANVGQRFGATGEEAGNVAVGQAYDKALNGVSVTADAPFEASLSNAVQGIRSIPRVGGEVADTVGTTLRPQPGGASYFDPATDTLSGRNMQPLLRELGDIRRGYQNDPLGNRVGGGVRNVEDAVTGMFDRQAPEVMPAFNAANTAYRNMGIVTDATNRAINTGRVFTPGQLGLSIRGAARYVGGKRAVAEGNTPFNDLQRFGQEVLPSTVPDSGTAGRLALLGAGSLLGGGGGYAGSGDGTGAEDTGMGVGKGLGLAALLLGGNRLSRRMAQTLLLSGGPRRALLGDQVAALPHLWDALGITGASQYASPQTLQPLP